MKENISYFRISATRTVDIEFLIGRGICPWAKRAMTLKIYFHFEKKNRFTACIGPNCN